MSIVAVCSVPVWVSMFAHTSHSVFIRPLCAAWLELFVDNGGDVAWVCGKGPCYHTLDGILTEQLLWQLLLVIFSPSLPAF